VGWFCGCYKSVWEGSSALLLELFLGSVWMCRMCFSSSGVHGVMLEGFGCGCGGMYRPLFSHKSNKKIDRRTRNFDSLINRGYSLFKQQFTTKIPNETTKNNEAQNKPNVSSYLELLFKRQFNRNSRVNQIGEAIAE
jgi:hypothetical protein